MTTTFNACEFVSAAEPIVRTERQELIESRDSRLSLPASRRVISIEKKGFGGSRPIVVFGFDEHGQKNRNPHICKGIIIHGESWLIEFAEENYYCGETRQNNVAIETFASVTLLS